MTLTLPTLVIGLAFATVLCLLAVEWIASRQPRRHW
jgi:hypothetical protein